MNALLIALSFVTGAEPGCAVEKAEAAAKAATTAFCAGKEGCVFEVRPADAKGLRVVMVSQVHSRDEKGAPRFMPEGFRFVDVSSACVAVRVWGHHVEPPPTTK